MKIRHDRFLGTRVTEDTYDLFVQKVMRLPVDRSQVLRELIESFVEDRVIIVPSNKRILK